MSTDLASIEPRQSLTIGQVVSLYWQLGDETTCERDKRDRRRILEGLVEYRRGPFSIVWT
jgi:hypothetical protein